MAQLDHLQLIRARVPIARRKTGGGSAPPGRGGGHGGALQTETRTAVAEQQAAKPAAFVDPSLLLRVQVDGHIAESEWEKLGLSVVSSDADRTVLLFSSTGDLTEFMVVSRIWWKFSGGVLRACGFGPDQAARSKLIGAMG